MPTPPPRRCRCPGLVDALLGHLARGFLLQLWVELLYQSIEAFDLLLLGLATRYPALQPGCPLGSLRNSSLRAIS